VVEVAQQTFRYIGSCAGVALTIAIATSAGSGPSGLVNGADLAMTVSAALALVGAVSVAVFDRSGSGSGSGGRALGASPADASSPVSAGTVGQDSAGQDSVSDGTVGADTAK
jgi:hypothetical protein